MLQNDLEIPMSEKHTCDNEDSVLSVLGPSRTCGTCGTLNKGKFCSNCGSPRP